MRVDPVGVCVESPDARQGFRTSVPQGRFLRVPLLVLEVSWRPTKNRQGVPPPGRRCLDPSSPPPPQAGREAGSKLKPGRLLSPCVPVGASRGLEVDYVRLVNSIFLVQLKKGEKKR